jgi:hypothetical protein
MQFDELRHTTHETHEAPNETTTRITVIVMSITSKSFLVVLFHFGGKNALHELYPFSKTSNALYGIVTYMYYAM